MKSRSLAVVASLAAMAFAAPQGASAAGGNTNPTTASLSLPSVSLSTVVNTPSSVSINLFDVGSPPLAISTISLAGAQASDYALAGTCVAGAVVNRSVGPCVIQVTFNPLAVGVRSAVINVTFANAPPISAALNGQGLSATPTAPALSVKDTTGSTPASIDFGSKPLGLPLNPPTPLSARADALLGITNAGGPGLIVSAAIIGANSADWRLVGTVPAADTCGTIVVNPLPAPCTLPISFYPTALGARTATVRFTSNDPTRPTVDIALTGSGFAAPVTPPSIVSLTDFTALWGAPNDASWTLSIVHHKFASATFAATDGLVAFWHTYDVNGIDVWFELKNGSWTDPLTYTGTLYRPTGSPFSAASNPAQSTDVVVGSATLSFADANNGTLTFSVNGVTGSKAITRGVGAF